MPKVTWIYDSQKLLEEVSLLPQNKAIEVTRNIDEAFGEFIYANGFDWLSFDSKTGEVAIDQSKWIYERIKEGNLELVMKTSMLKRRKLGQLLLSISIVRGKLVYKTGEIIPTGTKAFNKGKIIEQVKTRSEDLVIWNGIEWIVIETYFTSDKKGMGRVELGLATFDSNGNITKEKTMQQYNVDNPHGFIRTFYEFKTDKPPVVWIWGYNGEEYVTGMNYPVLRAEINFIHNQLIEAEATIKTKFTYIEDSLIDGLTDEEQEKLTAAQITEMELAVLRSSAISLSDEVQTNSSDGSIGSNINIQQLNYEEVILREDHLQKKINEYGKREGVGVSEKEGGTNMMTFEVQNQNANKYSKIKSYVQDDREVIKDIVDRTIEVYLAADEEDLPGANEARKLFGGDKEFLHMPIMKPADANTSSEEIQNLNLLKDVSQVLVKQKESELTGMPLWLLFKLTKEEKQPDLENPIIDVEAKTTPEKTEVVKEPGAPVKTP